MERQRRSFIPEFKLEAASQPASQPASQSVSQSVSQALEVGESALRYRVDSLRAKGSG